MESVEFPPRSIGICGIETHIKCQIEDLGRRGQRLRKGNLKGIRCIDDMGRGCRLQMLKNSEENNN